jgi:TatD DNase family protein
MSNTLISLIDTHAHPYLSEYYKDKKEQKACTERAKKNAIKAVILPNIGMESTKEMFELYDLFPDFFYLMMGLHPTSVNENWKEELEKIKNAFIDKNICGIGEVGIDLYWEKKYKEQQRRAFKQQIEWALDMNLPLSIHARDSFNEIDEVLQDFDFSVRQNSGVFHCFSGDEIQAEKLISRGFKLGIGGVVSFKNAGLDKIVANIDLKHLVLETDAPFLAPMPHRGKRNESAFLLLIAEKIAEIKEISIEQVAEITTQNAKKLFKIL